MNIKIESCEIGAGRRFVIAEIGNNHNGSCERAIQIVDTAVEMGADCAKFQMRHLDEVYRQRTLRKDGEDLGTEYVLDLLRRFELTVQQHRELADYCAGKGILYHCTPWDQRSVDVLEGLHVPAYKVASADLTNLPLLEKLCSTGKPLILSTGMSLREEVQITVDFLNKRKALFVLLQDENYSRVCVRIDDLLSQSESVYRQLHSDSIRKVMAYPDHNSSYKVISSKIDELINA